MKTTLLTLTALFMFATVPVLAEETHDHNAMGHMHDHSAETMLDNKTPNDSVADVECGDTVQINVDGMVCDFCARALEKVFGQHDDVDSINVNLNEAVVTIAMQPGQTMTDEELTKLITDSGYNVRSIERGCES